VTVDLKLELNWSLKLVDIASQSLKSPQFGLTGLLVSQISS
jgi:hypothetical protein